MCQLSVLALTLSVATRHLTGTYTSNCSCQDCSCALLHIGQELQAFAGVKKQPSQDLLHEDAAEKELGLARLVSSYTLPHQNSQPGRRGRQTACSKVLSRRARDT